MCKTLWSNKLKNLLVINVLSLAVRDKRQSSAICLRACIPAHQWIPYSMVLILPVPSIQAMLDYWYRPLVRMYVKAEAAMWHEYAF